MAIFLNSPKNDDFSFLGQKFMIFFNNCSELMIIFQIVEVKTKKAKKSHLFVEFIVENCLIQYDCC